MMAILPGYAMAKMGMHMDTYTDASGITHGYIATPNE